MLVCKVTKGLFKNALWKAENVSLGVITCPQNSSQTNQLYFVHKRYKKTSSDEKKRCEDKPKKSRKLAKLATIAVLGTTAAVLAAKYDDDFRDWAKENVPALDSLVKIIFQEEKTYLQSLDSAHKELSAWIKKALHDLFDRKDRSDNIVPISGGLPKLPPCDESKKPYKLPESAFAVPGDNKKEDAKAVQVPKEHKELKDLEDQLGRAAQDTIQSAASTACAARDHATLVDYLDQIISSRNHKIWKKIKKLEQDNTKGTDKTKENLVKFKAIEKQLTSKLDDDESSNDDRIGKAPNTVNSTGLSDDVKEKIRNNMNTLKKDVADAMTKLEKTQEDTNLAKRSWNKVKQARLYFSEQLETLFPNIWLNDEKLNIAADELDPFTENVLNDIENLEKQHTKIQTLYETQVNAAAEKYKKDPDGAIADLEKVAVPYEINKEKRKNQAELQKNMLAHKAKCEKNAKNMLKQTKEVYADLTAEALKLKEKDVERKMQLYEEEEMAKLKALHKTAIAKMVGRIQGANEAISKRGEKDKSQQNKQQFWSAAQSLMAAIKPIGAAAQAQEPKPLKNEITNLTKVKPEGDELVDSVLSSIPEEAVERGIPSEASLREKFNKVLKSARGWAGVPPGEISLLQLLLARIQSALYLNVAIPQAELDNEPAIDPKKLNNYDILNRAKYYVDKGEFDQAIRYLNLLKGPSSKVASDWVKDALVYLETRQAAEVLLAHATAASMQ